MPFLAIGYPPAVASVLLGRMNRILDSTKYMPFVSYSHARKQTSYTVPGLNANSSYTESYSMSMSWAPEKSNAAECTCYLAVLFDKKSRPDEVPNSSHAKKTAQESSGDAQIQALAKENSAP